MILKYKNYMIMFVMTLIVLLLTFLCGNKDLGSIAVLCLLLYGLIVSNIQATAILSFVLLSIINELPFQSMIATAFSNSMVLLIMFSFLFTAIIEKTGCMDYVSNKILSYNILKERQSLFIFSIYLIAILSAFFNAGLATIVFLWDFVVNINKKLNLEENSVFKDFMIITIPVIAATASLILPYKANMLMYISAFDSNMFNIYSYATYMMFAIAYVVILSLCFCFILKNLFNVSLDMNNIYINITNEKMTNNQKFGFLMVSLFFLLLILQQLVKTKLLINLNILGFIAIIILIYLISYNDKDKNSIYNSIQWDSIWIIMIILTISSIFKQNEYVSITIANLFANTMSALNPFLFIIVASIIIGVASQFASNTLVSVIFMPIFYVIGMEIGCNELILFMMLTFSVACSYITPAGSSMAAIIYGSHDINKKFAIKIGILTFIMSLIISIILFCFVGNFII